MAFYLKYRPQSLADLIGQEAPKKLLSGAFEAGKLSHAYLFVGPRGTGKTSTARILAKMVNCQNPPAGGPPCNKCSSCISITDGSNMDLIELDGASNRGIEDIRLLRDKIKLAPSSSKKKVYIIDEVHMLTAEAFNALLKTLEEPPTHVLFILATTDASKMPQTILSRVQRVDFKLASQVELMESLEKIVKEEKIDIEEKALKLLVKRADGSFRDGVKLLDQISSIKGKITAEILEKSLKSSNFEDILSLLENLSKKDTTASLSWINKQTEGGIDTKDLILSLMDCLRSLVFIKNGLGAELVEPNLMSENYQSLVKISEGFNNSDLVKSLDSMQKALEKLKIASIPSLPLEIAVVEICAPAETKFEPIKEQKSENVTASAVQSLSEQGESVADEPVAVGDASLIGEHSDIELGTGDMAKLKEKWTFVLETIRPYNFSLEALLRSIIVRECTQKSVIMEVPYSFHQRILEAPKNRDLLESILSDILERPIRISTVLGSRPSRKEDIANVEVAADDEIIRVAAEIFNSDSIN